LKNLSFTKQGTRRRLTTIFDVILSEMFSLMIVWQMGEDVLAVLNRTCRFQLHVIFLPLRSGFIFMKLYLSRRSGTLL